MLSAAEQLKAELPPEPEPRSKRASKTDGEFDLFGAANGVDTIGVLDRLGINHYSNGKDGEFADCPGCSEPNSLVCTDTGKPGGKPIGLACKHDRCSKAGPIKFRGFRTNVDLVMLVKGLKDHEAARQICEWWGIKVPEQKKAKSEAVDPNPDGFEDGKPEVSAAARNSDQKSEEKPSERRPLTPADVIGNWKTEGPLIHEPTGITKLDELTGGGPVYGTRWYVNGAPDAAKTLIQVQIAHTYLMRGIPVGLLAVDEEPSDIVTRLAQRIGYERYHCEVRDPAVLDQMLDVLGKLPLRLYDESWTIEAAAADLAAFAKTHNDGSGQVGHPRAMLGIDSVQTVRCNVELEAAASSRELSEVQAVTARVRAIRKVASGYRLIAMATSEFSRGAYNTGDPQKRTPTLAGAKWSGAVEFSARVLIGMHNVADEPDLIEVDFGKNKHGPKTEVFHLRIDRRAQTLTEVSYDAPPETDTGERDGAKDAAAKIQARRDAAALVAVLKAHPGLNSTKFRNKARALTGMGQARVSAGLAALDTALVVTPGSNKQELFSLLEDQIPADVLTHMETE